MSTYTCAYCKQEVAGDDAYEYRGAYSCSEHFDLVIEQRDRQRAEIIAEEDAKLAPLHGLDFGDNPVGRANREIMKRQREIASKESPRLRAYERGGK